FGEVAENHVGMQKLGNIAEEGLGKDDFKWIQKNFDEWNVKYKIYDLREYLPEGVNDKNYEGYASVMVIHRGVDLFLGEVDGESGSQKLYEEIYGLRDKVD